MSDWVAGGASSAEGTRVQSGNKMVLLDRGTEVRSVGTLYSFELI